MRGRGVWDAIARRANLPPDVTPHTLRHSFASEAGDLGFSELTIGVLLGHAKSSVTSKYVHGADIVLLAAADAVAKRINEQLGFAEPARQVVEADVTARRA
jgi:site-specific recombinase XerD